MASLKDADLSLKLGAHEGQERVLEAQGRLLALRLQSAGCSKGPSWGRRCACCSRAGTRRAREARSGGW